MEPFFLLRSSDDEDYQEDGRWDSVSLGSSHRRSGGFSYLKATLSSSAKQRQTRHAQCRFASMPIPPKQQKDVTLSAPTLHQGVSGKTYGNTAKNVNTLTSRKFQTNPRVSSSDIASKCAAISTGKQSMVATHISQKVSMHEDKDMVTKWRQEREICRAITEEYKEEVLELERKLKCKKEELQNLMGNESENMHQRKMLEDKLKSQDPGQSDGEGYKLADRFKIETWYYLMKEEAMLHILFEKYLESCSFIEHNSTPATVIQLIKNELELIELTDFPTSLIKTGVQRRINRLKKLNEHVIIMMFFRDMIGNDYMKKYWGSYSEDLRSHLKAKEEFSYLNDLDDLTFYGAFQEFMFLFPHSFKGDDIEHIVRTLEQSLNEVFDNAYREILKSCEIEEKDVVYYDAFDELEKEFGGSEGISSHYISAAGLKSWHMKVGISKRAVMNDQGGEVDMRNQEEMIKEGKDIEKPGDMDQWFGLHKWTITGDHVSQLTAAFTFQTRYGEKLTELPKSGLVRRAQNNHKTERQRLQSHVDIIVRAIVEQLWKADFYLDENSSDDEEDDKMSENKLEVTESSDYDQNAIKIDDPDICDANPEAVVEQLLCFDNKLNEFSEINHDSSSEEILAQLIANQKLLITRKLAKCHIERKICQVAEFRRLDQYNIFLQNLVDSCPYISLHEDIEETYKRLKSDNKLYGLPDCMVYVGLQYFRDLLHYLENPYDSRLREAHRADLLDIINMECKIKRRSKMQFRKLINYGYPVYDEFRKRLIMRDYAEVYDSARSMISLHRKFDYHLASFSFIKFDIFREENFKDKRLIPEEYSILPRNLIVQSINFWYVMLEKKHELRRCAELVKYLLSECAKSFDEEQFLSDSKKNSDLPKHIILRGILVRKRILECTGTSKIKVRLSTAYSFCSQMNRHIMMLWERTRYYEDQIYEVPLILAEKKDLNALNLDVPIWDIFFNKPLPKNGVILMKMSEDGKLTVDVKVVPEENI